MPIKKFIHIPPKCILLMPSANGDGGAYFEATCTACPDRGTVCYALDHGYCAGVNIDDEIMIYNKTRGELEAMLLAMNGGKMLAEWKEERKDERGA